MKKLLLLSLSILFLTTSCSTDSDEIIAPDNTHSTERAAQAAAETSSLTGIGGGCFSTLDAHMYNTGSLAAPIISYIADVPAGASTIQGFKITLQIQATDCEDITVGYGDIINITNSTVFYNVSNIAPHIEVKPEQTLPCFRWRILLQGISLGRVNNTITCSSYTQWYDAPVL